MMAALYLLFAAICGLGATQVFSPTCMDSSDGKSCTIKSELFILKVFGNTVYIGVNNSIELYDAIDFEHSSITITASEERIDTCNSDLGFNRRLCHNLVMGIEEYSESELAVCGSNGFLPLCRLHRRDMLENSTILFSENAAGYSGFGRSHPTPATFIASNGHFFTIAQFATFGGQELLLRMAPNYLQGNLTLEVTTPFNVIEIIYSPTVIFSFYEFEDRIYVYYTERAADNVQIPFVVYSRVARVCINDLGVEPQVADASGLPLFRTFEKARIICLAAGSSFVYNVMLGTSADADLDGTPVVYATFNAPLDGPPGGIICKISSQLPGVFSDQFFTVQSGSETFSTEIADFPVNCPGSGQQRSAEEAKRFILHRSVVMGEPLISQQAMFLDKIASEIIQHRGIVQEIIFFTTMRGDIRQLIRSSNISHDHTIYTAQTEQQIKYLVLHKYNGSRSLIAATDSQIMQFNRGRCYCYIDCYTCLTSKDPYCGWNTSIRACISKLAYSNDQVVEAFSASAQDIANTCGMQESPSSPLTYSCPLQPFDSIATTVMETTTEETMAVPTTDFSTDFSTTTVSDDAITTTTAATARFINDATEQSTQVVSGLDTKVVDAIIAIIAGIVTALVLLTVGVLIPLLRLKLNEAASKPLFLESDGLASPENDAKDKTFQL